MVHKKYFTQTLLKIRIDKKKDECYIHFFMYKAILIVDEWIFNFIINYQLVLSRIRYTESYLGSCTCRTFVTLMISLLLYSMSNMHFHDQTRRTFSCMHDACHLFSSRISNQNIKIKDMV